MRIPRLETTALLAALVAALTLAFAAPSYATNAGEQVILHCTHQESLGGFSQSAYRQALKDLESEADLEEYSGCASEISEAERAAAGAAPTARPGAPCRARLRRWR